MNSISKSIAESHPSLSRGQVWCTVCGYTTSVKTAQCLGSGWPKHCGYTMTIDSPAERLKLSETEAVTSRFGHERTAAS